jgi:hypothetical protein
VNCHFGRGGWHGWVRIRICHRTPHLGNPVSNFIDGRSHFLASSIGVIPGAIKFDASFGRFFVAGSYPQVDFLEAARQARRGREPGPIDV